MTGPPNVIISRLTVLVSVFLLQILLTFATGSGTTKSSHESHNGHEHEKHNGHEHETHNGHDEHDAQNAHGHVETTTFLFDRRVMLERDKLVPDVLDAIPKRELFVSYYSMWVNFGNLVSCSACSCMPTVLDWKTEPDTYYTVIMTGPDCPSQKNHTDREYLHWMVVNIKGTEFMDGETQVEYIGASPAYVTEAHRFLYIVFKQPEPQKMTFHEQPIFDAFPFNEKRRKFSSRNFAKKYGLEPIASNYFWIDLDKPYPTFEPWFRTPDISN